MSEHAAIAQDYLDRMGRAMIAGDWDIYQSGVALPFVLISAETQIVVADLATLRAGFDTFLGYVQAMHLTDMARLVGQTARLDPVLLSVTYVNHVMAGGARVVPPFTSHMVLRLVDGTWRAVSIANGMKARTWPIISYHIPRETPS
jgi:hypothetical protein